jgi:hypothetical protein
MSWKNRFVKDMFYKIKKFMMFRKVDTMSDKLIDHVPTNQIDSIFFDIPDFLAKLPDTRTILLILFFVGIFIIGLYNESRGKK